MPLIILSDFVTEKFFGSYFNIDTVILYIILTMLSFLDVSKFHLNSEVHN